MADPKWPTSKGAIAEQIRGMDWASTPLGEIESWPLNLRHTLDLMLGAGVQIVLFWGPQYIALYNDAYVQTIGDKHPRALGRPAIENWPELWGDLEPLLESVRRTGEMIFAKDRPFYIERHGYGEDVFFDISYSTVRDDAGEIGGVLCIVNETTDRVLAERASREAEAAAARLAAIVQSSDDAIISKDLNGIITSWNAGAQRLFGYEPDEAIGRPVTMLIPDDRLEEENDIIARIRRGERTDHFETKRRRKDGSIFDISLSISPVKDRHGRVIGASKIGRDITERIRGAETQALLINELNHRVKNTLASVQAIAQQTLRRTRSAEEFVNSFSGRIQSLARVHTLLGASTWRGADLRELVQDQLSQGPMEERRISVFGPQLQLGPQRTLHLAMILHELGTNAAKYGALSGPNGTITVQWTVEDRTLHLLWQERGGPTVRVGNRRGFGTTLIEQSAKGEGGTARMNVLANGIDWEIALPLPRSEGIPDLAANLPESRMSENKLQDVPRSVGKLVNKRFLVIEDEPLVALDLEYTLTDAGADVVAAVASPADALRIIESEPLDIALLDGNLNGQPVDDIAAALTRHKIPFVFITGYQRENLPEGFRQAPLLSKPFSPAQLLQAATDLLERGADVASVASPLAATPK